METVIINGKSYDTSMGFTPLEGLMMGTRCGDLDVGAVTYIMDKEMIGTRSASTLFNKHSGMLGITGISSDMREIENAIEKGDSMAILGMDMYNYRIKKYIGAYVAAMGGVDTLIFTGGIGENGDKTRKAICSDLQYMGLEIEDEKNDGLRSKEMDISKNGAKVRIMVIPTNEELVIAQDTKHIVEGLKKK